MRKTPNTRVKTATMLLLVLFFATAASAQSEFSDEEPMLGYDAIVNGLNREFERPNAGRLRGRMTPVVADPFDTILFHVGAGLATLMQPVTLDDGTGFFLGQKGVQAAFGIDLFSRNWLTEGTVRSFAETEEGAVRASLQEFELKLVYRERVARQLDLRLGSGLAARYLKIRRSGLSDLDYTTPSAVATLGLDLYFTERLSVGAEANGRTAFINETPDKGSIDATMRVDMHF